MVRQKFQNLVVRPNEIAHATLRGIDVIKRLDRRGNQKHLILKFNKEEIVLKE